MRITVTNFNVLKSLHEWEGFRPYNFFLLPVLDSRGGCLPHGLHLAEVALLRSASRYFFGCALGGRVPFRRRYMAAAA